MKKAFYGAVAYAALSAGCSCVADPLLADTARIEAIERENALLRKENAALRERARLQGENVKLRERLRAGSPPEGSATRSRAASRGWLREPVPDAAVPPASPQPGMLPAAMASVTAERPIASAYAAAAAVPVKAPVFGRGEFNLFVGVAHSGPAAIRPARAPSTPPPPLKALVRAAGHSISIRQSAGRERSASTTDLPARPGTSAPSFVMVSQAIRRTATRAALVRSLLSSDRALLSI